ncbi:MAG: transposase [Planctomycetaceae bacterium]|nr:transposase [Planctomycetaceae bacterium]
MNAASMKRLIKRLARSHPNAKMIHVILDNAGYCCSKELLAYCNELGNIYSSYLKFIDLKASKPAVRNLGRRM